jgi:hypothetical protein
MVYKSNGMASQSLKSNEARSLKIFMVQRGLTVAGVAASCGVKRVTLSNQLTKNFPSRHFRIVIENVLDKAFWSTPAELDERRQLIARCGFDPYLMTAEQIYQYLGVLKIRGRSKCVRRRKELIAFLQSTLQPKTTNPQ